MYLINKKSDGSVTSKCDLYSDSQGFDSRFKVFDFPYLNYAVNIIS